MCMWKIYLSAGSTSPRSPCGQRLRGHCRSWSHRDQQPRLPPPHPCARLPSANPHRLTRPPDWEGASLFKSSLWNKRRNRFSLSFSLSSTSSFSSSLIHLCSVFPLFPHHHPLLAVSTSSGLRKLCYHGDAWGWSPIGGVCCDAAGRWCSPPDRPPAQRTSFLQRPSLTAAAQRGSSVQSARKSERLYINVNINVASFRFSVNQTHAQQNVFLIEFDLCTFLLSWRVVRWMICIFLQFAFYLITYVNLLLWIFNKKLNRTDWCHAVI